eukprot:Gregarina_sp_Pseudo_9__3169@NODE_335_length_3126_cov_16_342404_g315_i0_p1_GENE_NODE_335_length_3126_cov_16_342404_g315_i0NODE_335_length_3126_cov_16_342404_g315_i0_p1_ORF_typecomplete_len237_score18_38UQ_con/PF00179_26/1e12SapB_1/PF05184_15/5_3e03SapB_1/PF05184_15/0_073Endonucdimeris/PF09124_10/0_24_NODE_335_length_3126_cov_16_342404_g315_i018362546
MLCDWVIDSCITIANYDFDQDPEWTCVIVPTSGIYEGQALKFKLLFSPEYPTVEPVCQFVAPIPKHPLIDKESGILDLRVKFREWNPDSHCIVQVLAFVRRIFRDPRYLQDFSEEFAGIKQPEFIETAKKRGLDLAASNEGGSQALDCDAIIDHLFGKAPAVSPTASFAVSQADIQAAVENVCNKLPSSEAQIYNRGLHYRHDDMATIRTEADALFDMLIGAVVSNVATSSSNASG